MTRCWQAPFPIVLLFLAACSTKPAVETTDLAAEEGLIPATAYVCEDGRTVRAYYPDRKTATLDLEGETRRLRLVVSGSGARYTGAGLQWWSKGDEAMLAVLASREEIASDPGVRCVPASRAVNPPPRPGAPGGLAEQRTPLDESPARAGSAQAAATVVETYLALLESGRTEDAARLRADGAQQDLGSYLTLGAQVGAPGRITRSPDALFVEVPVSIYGRYATGDAYYKGGKVVLRRARNGLETTAQQRQWRIERIDLQSSSSASRPIR